MSPIVESNNTLSMRSLQMFATTLRLVGTHPKRLPAKVFTLMTLRRSSKRKFVDRSHGPFSGWTSIDNKGSDGVSYSLDGWSQRRSNEGCFAP